MTVLSSRLRLSLLLLAAFCMPCVARAQSGGASVNVSGGVSGTVMLSSPGVTVASAEGVRASASHTADRSLLITLSGSTRGLTRLAVPVQIRSNTAYTLRATLRADGSDVSRLSVADARPTGHLVAADAAKALRVAAAFDARPGAVQTLPAGGLDRLRLPSPLELLGGPLVSLGGSPQTPQNALEVTLALSVESHAGGRTWTIELLLSATPAARF
ncbi:MAG TPA: hypothetical protein VF668_03095 [Pyrinomonadaceae bacterium]|jgi:hypothetical protein